MSEKNKEPNYHKHIDRIDLVLRPILSIHENCPFNKTMICNNCALWIEDLEGREEPLTQQQKERGIILQYGWCSFRLIALNLLEVKGK